MARPMTPAQWNNMVRRLEREQRQAVSDYNRRVRSHNAAVKQAAREQQREIDRYNAALKQAAREEQREIDRYNAAIKQVAREEKREIESYNRAVQKHNQRVRADRDRLRRELQRLDAQPQPVPISASAMGLSSAYERVDAAATSGAWEGRPAEFADLAETETANGVAVANAMLSGAAEEHHGPEVSQALRRISPDLHDRWEGALFSLDPRNPDAARHFCTSSREILSRVIELGAPDAEVLEHNPECLLLDDGRPVRRAKVGYLLSRSEADHPALRDFVEVDVEDILGLFREFNNGTHGRAGVLDVGALRALKMRVEGAIRFVTTMAAPPE